MHAETPEGRNSSSPLEQIPLLKCDFRACLTQQKSEIKHATNNFVLDESLVVCLADNNIHRIGVSQIVEMEMLKSFFLEVHWVVSISLLSCAFVKDLSSVSVKYCPFPFSFSKRCRKSLSQSV